MAEVPANSADMRGERRLPMTAAVLVDGLLYLFLPAQFRVLDIATYAYPAFLLILVAILTLGDPGRIDRQTRWLRTVTGVMIGTMTVATAAAAVRLVVLILEREVLSGTGQLLATGAIIWVMAVIAFALWYWHLDSGGPGARVHASFQGMPAFRFREQDLEDPGYDNWYPQFVDYLALSFNTSTTFGPTDVSPIRHWSKLWLMTQSGDLPRTNRSCCGARRERALRE